MSKKILVADDSVVIQKSIGISFAQEDFQVTFVGNGEEAFQRAKEIKPDLILADTSMPKLSGVDLCKKFRLEPDFRRTPMILLASTQESFNPSQLKACGANDFIQKPFESSVLIEKVKNLFSQIPDTTVATAKAQTMEKSIDHAFSTSTQFSEEETAITRSPVPPLDIEKSDNISVDPMMSYNDPQPTPSENTLANLDVLSMDISQEHQPQSLESPASTTETQLSLSDAQIEQIVSKVFKNVIERIAWEVVPDMAERIIKDELRKITDDTK